MKTLTPARRHALTVLRNHPRSTAASFSRLMWPDSKGHSTRSHRHATPAGGAMGAGIKMRAGVFLNRLERDGLVWNEHDGLHNTAGRWSLSGHGKLVLAAAERDAGE